MEFLQKYAETIMLAKLAKEERIQQNLKEKTRLTFSSFEAHSEDIMRSLFCSREFADVSFFVDGQNVKAHKAILAASSEEFRKIFTNPGFEASANLIATLGVPKATLEQALRFIYLGVVEVPTCDLEEFMRFARSYKLKGMERLMEPEVKSTEIQSRELDLSQRKFPSPNQQSSEKMSSVPNLTPIPPPQAHINSQIMNPFGIDNTLLNTLAMQSPRLFNQQSLARSSPMKASIVSPNCTMAQEPSRRDSVTSGGSVRRSSHSPESLLNPNTTLDLTKVSTSSSPLNRLNLPNLASVASGLPGANMTTVSAVLATQLQHIQQHQQMIMESQQQQQQEQANRDQQQETEEIEVADRRCGSAQEENHVNRSRSHGSSSPHSSLQSGKLSETLSDPNNFSDDDRGSDAKIEVDDEQQEDGNNGGNGESGNPAANFNQRHSGLSASLPWNYNGNGDDGIKPAVDNEMTAEILKHFIANPGSFPPDLLGHPASSLPLFSQMSLSRPLASPMHHLVNHRGTAHSTPVHNGSMGDSMTLNSHIANLLQQQQMDSMSPHSKSVKRQLEAQNHDKPSKKKKDGQGFNPKTERFECEKCDRTYASQGNLKRHLKFECQKEPQFGCPLCSIKFQHRHSMKIHLRGNHLKTFDKEGNVVDLPPGDELLKQKPIKRSPKERTPSSTPGNRLSIAEDHETTADYLQRAVRAGVSPQSVIGGCSSQPPLRTTAEVSVASVAPNHSIDAAAFMALQRSQAQQSTYSAE